MALNSARASPAYLLFQVFSYNPDPRASAAGIADKTPSDIARTVDDILSLTGGDRGDHRTAQLGFVVGPLSWDQPDDRVREIIDTSFQIAEQKDVAVGFHIDDSMFWLRRRDLWSDRDNIEWSNWDGASTAHRIIGWVGGGMPILAPPMCYNSPAIERETIHRARDVIGREIKRNVDRLARLGRSYLFAGVIAGWETRLQDDSGTFLGYCALHNLGYRVLPPGLDQVLQGVVANWITLWTRALASAGLAHHEIFTHIAFPGPDANPPGANLLRDVYKDSDPNVTAFNAYSDPGFSVYGAGNVAALVRMLEAHPRGPWGISEGNDVDLAKAHIGNRTNTAAYAQHIAMDRYLRLAFDNGARYVTIFGVDDPGMSPFAQVTHSPAAAEAYRRFLSSAK